MSSAMSSVPADGNPFSYQRAIAPTLRFPTVPHMTYAILFISSAIHLFTSALCVIVIFRLSWSRSAIFGDKHKWLFKRIILQDDCGNPVTPVPLYLPNSGRLMAYFQLIASVIAQIFIYLTYFSFRSVDFAAEHNLAIWTYAIWLFMFYEFWVMAWASVYTRLYTQTNYAVGVKSGRLFMISPRVLNVFFVTIPIFVTVLECLFIFWNTRGFRSQLAQWRDLLETMEQAANSWEVWKTKERLSPDPALTYDNDPGVTMQKKQLILKGLNLWEADSFLIEKERCVAFFWAAIFFITAILYAGAMWSLVALIRGVTRKFGRPSAQIGLTSRGSLIANDRTMMSEYLSSIGSRVQKLRLGYLYLVWHSFVMFFTISYLSSVCWIIGFRANSIVRGSYWRGIGSWLSLASGLLMAFGMMIQFWRIHVNLDIMIPVGEPRVVAPHSPCYLGSDESDTKTSTKGSSIEN